MKYISTRGQSPQMSFCEVLLSGLATDGGLSMPKEYPQISAATLDAWRRLDYPSLAFEIMRLFIDDIPEEDLRFLVNKTYTAEVFGSAEITPLRTLKDGLHVLGLSNGPTLAFKDIAMQFLGNVFEYVLSKQSQTLNILGATSGDTGSAAEYAMRGKYGISVFMLSPHNKMSAFQRAQMYSLQDENIFNIAVEGMFDDCQDIVKNIQSDLAFKEKYRIGTVNSINWARILAQVVYYFKAYFAVSDHNEQRVSFCVPSGNFGDICAGHVARMMGLPIGRLVVATNENDVLDEFFQSGQYRPRAAREVAVTSSPSMDIAKASNLERFVFDLVERDTVQMRALWAEVAAGRGFDLQTKKIAMQQQFGFTSGRSTHGQRIDTIRAVYAEDHEVIDPHTAAGVYVARQLSQAGETMICLETALPAKFEETIREALGADFAVPRPSRWDNIEQAAQRVQVMPNNADAVKMYLRENLDKIID
ncbi:MAG: threonine synthase [Neisseria sp.]|nr:threonine synthase [Neisseria sp.]